MPFAVTRRDAIAFKRRQPHGANGRFIWMPHVLDLASGKVLALSIEPGNVEDQLEWLDPQHVLYGMPAGGRMASAQADGLGLLHLKRRAHRSCSSVQRSHRP